MILLQPNKPAIATASYDDAHTRFTSQLPPAIWGFIALIFYRVGPIDEAASVVSLAAAFSFGLPHTNCQNS